MITEHNEALIEAWCVRQGTRFRLRGYGPDYTAAGKPEVLIGDLDNAIDRNAKITIPVEEQSDGVRVRANDFIVEL